MDKVATCPRADDGLEARVSEMDFVFTNLPATTSSDRHEHAFPVTDSSGQTLPHNVYH